MFILFQILEIDMFPSDLLCLLPIPSAIENFSNTLCVDTYLCAYLPRYLPYSSVIQSDVDFPLLLCPKQSVEPQHKLTKSDPIEAHHDAGREATAYH